MVMGSKTHLISSVVDLRRELMEEKEHAAQSDRTSPSSFNDKPSAFVTTPCGY